jgi:excisionase family DNA binding protein
MTGSLLTADQVAELLGVPKSCVYEQPRAGRIPTVTLGRYRRYRREAIEAWVLELEQGQRPLAAIPSSELLGVR